MEENYSEYSTYLLVKRYQAEPDKKSTKAVELEKLIRDDLGFSDDVDLLAPEIQDKLNKLVRESKRRSEQFINITSWILIALILLSLFNSGCSLMTISSASKFLPNIESMLNENINPVARFILENQIPITILSFILLGFMLFVLVGVLYRSDTARKMGIILLVSKIAQNFAEPLLVKYVYPSLHDLKFDVPKPIADLTYQTSLVMSAFVSVIFIVIYGWLIYKFTTPEIKEEFN